MFFFLFFLLFQILMNVAKVLMTVSPTLLPAKILLDHTTVLVTLDMKETERQAAIGFQARKIKIDLKKKLHAN